MVNDGSIVDLSGSIEIISSQISDVQVLSYNENAGKGYALRRGVEAATGDVVMYTDVDFPYTRESMVRIIEAVLTGHADIAIGVRNRTYYERLPILRRWISHWLRNLNKVLLGLKESDTQGGLKAMNQRGRRIFLATRINRYLFDLEFIYLASRAPATELRSIEVDLREGLHFAQFKYAVLIQEGFNFLKLLLASLFGGRKGNAKK